MSTLNLRNLHFRRTLDNLREPETESVSLNDYPMDAVLIRTESRSVYNILLKIKEGTYIIPPTAGSDAEYSTLIEEILMRLPAPPLYSVEDMQARKTFFSAPLLTALRRLLNNNLTLDLPHRSELHGKKFEDLSPKWQNRIEDCSVTFHVIDAKMPKQVQMDIVARVQRSRV